MKKEFIYEKIRFTAEILKSATEQLLNNLEIDNEKLSYYLSVDLEDGSWDHDNEEEFFSDYRRSNGHGVYQVDYNHSHTFRVQFFPNSSNVQVKAPTRAEILSVYNILDKSAELCRLPEPEVVPKQPVKPVIFIGHGRSMQWRDLKDHLGDKHGFEIEAYEIGARAGHAIRDILQEMLIKSSFAILVMTGEDDTLEGNLRARQNVIHEAGLFQGKLGFHRAIILLEKGTEEFSNIHGIEQIRFNKNNIKETYGEILAVLQREFPRKFR